MENNLKERLTILLPTDEEVEQWYSDNIDESIATVSNSIYKFRLFLKDRLDELMNPIECEFNGFKYISKKQIKS